MLLGCAAMKRTWVFQAQPVAAEPVRVVLKQADITQKTAFVSFTVENTSQRAVQIEVGTFTLTLPDGTSVSGKTALFDRGYEGARGLLEQVGWIDKQAKPGLLPGKSLEVALAFRQYGRDLRRHPTLSVALDALSIDGHAAKLPPLVLTPPPGAPLGEDI